MGYAYNIANPVDQEWSTTLFEMNRCMKEVCLSAIEQRFLDNLQVLEETKNIVKGCEELEYYKQLASQEGFIEDLWAKIKKFFVDLWNKFVAWFKNIPNWFRPYIKRCISLKDNLGHTVKMDPIPQNVMLSTAADINTYVRALNQIKVDLVSGIPTLLMLTTDATGAQSWVTVRGNIKPIPVTNIIIHSEAELIAYIDGVVANYEGADRLASKLANAFDSFSAKTEADFASGAITTSPGEIVKAFNEDLQLVMGYQKQMIEFAKNLSNIKTKPL